MTTHTHIHSTNSHAKYPSTPSLDHHERVVSCPSVHPQILDSFNRNKKTPIDKKTPTANHQEDSKLLMLYTMPRFTAIYLANEDRWYNIVFTFPLFLVRRLQLTARIHVNSKFELHVHFTPLMYWNATENFYMYRI